MSRYQYNPDLGRPLPISFNDFTTRTEQDYLTPGQRHALKVQQEQVPEPNEVRTGPSPQAVQQLLDNYGSFGVSFLNSWVGTGAVKINSLLMNNQFTRRMMSPDDPLRYVPINFTDDPLRGGPEEWVQQINNKEAIKQRLIESGVPEQYWPELVGTDPENPKSVAQFEQDLVAMMLADENLEEKHGSWAGWGAGLATDIAGLRLLSTGIGAPIVTAIGGGATTYLGLQAGGRVATALGFAGAATVETAIIQAYREGTNPLSRPDFDDVLIELGLGTVTGGGIGAIFGGTGVRGIVDRFRNVRQEVPIAPSGAIVVSGQPAARRSVRVTPDTDYKLLVDARYGDVLHATQDVPLLEGSVASIANSVDDLADGALVAKQGGQKGGSLLNDLLDELDEAGVPLSPQTARLAARSMVRRWYDGLRGMDLRNSVLDDLRPIVNDDAMAKLRPAVVEAAPETTALARTYQAEVLVTGPNIPNRGPVLDLIELVRDSRRAARVAKTSPVVRIITTLQRRLNRDLTGTEIDTILSDMYTLVRNPQNIKAGLKEILAKHLPQGTRIPISSELVTMVEKLNGSPGTAAQETLNPPNRVAEHGDGQSSLQQNVNQASVVAAPQPVNGPSSVVQAQIPSVTATAGSAATPSGGTFQPTTPSGPVPTGGATGAVPPSPPSPPPPPPPPPGTPLSRARALNDAIPFLDRMQVSPVSTQKGLNQYAASLNHPNPIVRIVGMMGYAKRTLQTHGAGATPQGWTIIEEGNFALNGHLLRVNEMVNRRFVQFISGGNTRDRTWVTRGMYEALRPGNRSRRNDFYSQVISRVRSGHTAPGSVNPLDQTVEETRQIIKDIYEPAHALGVAGFRDAPDPNYFPRVWNWDGIIELSRTTEGQQALQLWFEGALTTQYVGGIPARQVRWDDGTVDVYTDVPEAARVFVEALQNIAADAAGPTERRVGRWAPLTDHDQIVFDSLNNLGAPIGGTTGRSRSVHGRPRVILNENHVQNLATPVQGQGGTLNQITLSDLAINDLPFILRKYAISVQAAINEHRAIDMFNQIMVRHNIMAPAGSAIPHVQIEQIGKIIPFAEKFRNIDPNTFGGILTSAEREVINNTIDALTYRPVFSVGNLGFGGKILEEMSALATSAVYVLRGGSFAISAIPEMNRIAGMFGTWEMFRAMPFVVKELALGWANMGDPTRHALAALDAAFHPNTDRRLKSLYFAGAADEPRRFGNIMRHTGNRVGSWYADFSGLNPVTSVNQTVNSVVTLRHFQNVGSGTAAETDDGTLQLMGLTRQQYRQVAAWVHRNIVQQRRLGFMQPIDIRNTNDPEFFMLRGAIDRSTQHNIQSMPTQGDYGKWAFRGLGPILTTFRKYSLKGIDNYLFQNIDRMRFGGTRGRIRVLKTLIMLGFFGGLTKWLVNQAKYEQAIANGELELANQIQDRSLSKMGFARGAADSITELFLPAMVIDNAYNALTGNGNIFSNYNTNPLTITGLPHFSVLRDMMSVFGDVFGEFAYQLDIFLNRQRRVTVETTKNVVDLTPFGSLPFVGDELKELAEWFFSGTIPEDQPTEPSAAFKEQATRKQRR